MKAMCHLFLKRHLLGAGSAEIHDRERSPLLSCPWKHRGFFFRIKRHSIQEIQQRIPADISVRPLLPLRWSVRDEFRRSASNAARISMLVDD